MSIADVRRVFEKRRANLVHTLHEGNLDSAKKHQVYGAVKEIENFLKALDYERENEIQENVKLENEQRRPLFNINFKRDED